MHNSPSNSNVTKSQLALLQAQASDDAMKRFTLHRGALIEMHRAAKRKILDKAIGHRFG